MIFFNDRRRTGQIGYISTFKSALFENYLVWDLFYRNIGPRSKVWSEKELVDAAAYEFAEVKIFFMELFGASFLVILLKHYV